MIISPTGIQEILTELGYQLLDKGKEFRARPIYRNSDNNTSLCIFKDNGNFVDFSANIRGSFLELIKLTKGFKSMDEVNKFLENKKESIQTTIVRQKVHVKSVRIYPNDILLRLLPKYDLFLDRGISKETLAKFQVGMAHSGKMRLRLSAPIYNANHQIIGFWGRWFKNQPPENVSKYKIVGPKALFVYPTHLPEFDSKNKTVIIVESPSDVLYCWEHGIRNVICLFGVKMLAGVLKYLVSSMPKKIIIALNNEADNDNIGNLAAIEIKKKLLNYFDEKIVQIHLPPKKDLATLSKDELLNWNNQIGVNN